MGNEKVLSVRKSLLEVREYIERIESLWNQALKLDQKEESEQARTLRDIIISLCGKGERAVKLIRKNLLKLHDKGPINRGCNAIEKRFSKINNAATEVIRDTMNLQPSKIDKILNEVVKSSIKDVKQKLKEFDLILLRINN